MKKLLLASLICCMCLCGILFGGFCFADNSITPSVFYMKDGASVSKDELAIRFATYVSKDVYDYYADNYDTTVGTVFIFENDYDGNAEDVDVNTNGVTVYYTTPHVCSDKNLYEFISVFANIDVSTAMQRVVAKSFLCVDGEYFYVDNVQVYSYDYVASMALKYGEKGQLFKDTLNDTIQSITVNQTEVSLGLGEQSRIVADTVPSGCALTYKTSDSKVATVDENGLITAVGDGTATVTVSCANVTNRVQVTCTIAKCKVTFVQDGVADIIKYVSLGEALTDIPQITAQKVGHTAKWSVTNFDKIMQDLTVTVLYERIVLTITFVQSGVDDIVREVFYGEELTNVPQITQQPEEGFVYRWSIDDFGIITDNLTVTVIKSPLNCTVTFRQEGLPDVVKNVSYGDAVKDIPTINSIAPIGYYYVWSVDDFSCIRDNLVVTPVLKAKQYTITYQTELGSLADVTQVATYGEMTTLATPSDVFGFTFVCWQRDGVDFASQVWQIDSDVTLTAIWSEHHESFENGYLTGLTSSTDKLQIGVEICQFTSYGNKALALRMKDKLSVGYLQADKAIFDKLFADNNVDALAFDIYCTADVANNLYFCYNGTGNYSNGDVSYNFEEVDPNVGLLAGKWYTVTFSRKYYEKLSSGAVFKLLCIRYCDALVYIDNVRTVGTRNTVNYGEVYLCDELPAVQYFDFDNNVTAITCNGSNIAFSATDNGVAINKNVLQQLSDKPLTVTFQNKDELTLKYHVKTLTKLTDTVATTYGSQKYYTINKQSVKYVICNGSFVPCERSDTLALVPCASLVEHLPTVNGEKQNGTVKLIVITDSESYLYVLQITLSGSTTEKSATSYQKDEFDHLAYTGLINGTEVNPSAQRSIIYYDLEHMQRYKESGLNVLQVGSTCALRMDATSLREEMKVILTNAEKVGLKVVIDDNFFKVHSESTTSLVGSGCVFASQNDLDNQTLQHLQLYWDYPAFYGLKLDDEPSFNQFVAYGQITNSIKRVAEQYGKQVFLNCNLLPCFATSTDLCGSDGVDLDTAYTTYLTKFIEYTGLDYLEYDLYPLLNNNSVYGKYNVRQWTLRNLNLASKVAKHLGVDLHVVTQTCTLQNSHDEYYDGNTRIMSQDDIAWLNNMIIAFGAKQIDYFTYYQRITTGDEKFLDGGCFVNSDDNVTQVYYDMQKALSQQNMLAPMVKSYDYQQFNFITGSKVSGTSLDGAENFDTDSFLGGLTAISVNKEYALLTTLKDGDGNYMYAVQNVTDPLVGAMQSVTLTFSGKTYVEIYQDGARRVVYLTSNKLVLNLSQGNAVFVIAH